MTAKAADTRIGISGWRYTPWRGAFYPDDLAQKRELWFASRKLNSIEINGSFYSLQRPSSWKAWHAETPPGFVFAVKCPRYITHMRRLKNIDEPLANFFASGVLALDDKLGPMLWQFPPNFKFDAERFADFFALLPKDSDAAIALAKRHGPFMKGRALVPRIPNRPLRHAIEFRHASFLVPEFVALCRKHNIGIVLADTAQLHPYTEDITADFVYIRLHGAEQIYASGYTAPALQWWADRIRLWQRGGEPADASKVSPLKPPRARARDLYVYFDNDIKVMAPRDAAALAAMLAVTWEHAADVPVRKKKAATKPRKPAKERRPPPYTRRA